MKFEPLALRLTNNNLLLHLYVELRRFTLTRNHGMAPGLYIVVEINIFCYDDMF